MKFEELSNGGLRFILEELTSYDQDRFKNRFETEVMELTKNGRVDIISEARNVYLTMAQEDIDNMALVSGVYGNAKQEMRERLLSHYFDDLFKVTKNNKGLSFYESIELNTEEFNLRKEGISNIIEFYACSKAINFIDDEELELCYEDKQFFDGKKELIRVFENSYDEFIGLLGEYIDDQESILTRMIHNFHKQEEQYTDELKESVELSFNMFKERQQYLSKTHELLSSV